MIQKLQKCVNLVDLVKSFAQGATLYKVQMRVQGSDAEEHSNDDDGNKRKDDDADRPGQHCARVGDVSTQKKHKDGYRKKEAESAAPGRRKKDASGD